MRSLSYHLSNPFHSDFSHIKLVSTFPKTVTNFTVDYAEISYSWIKAFKRAMATSSNIIDIEVPREWPESLFKGLFDSTPQPRSDGLIGTVAPSSITKARPSSPSQYKPVTLIAGIPFIQDQSKPLSLSSKLFQH